MVKCNLLAYIIILLKIHYFSDIFNDSFNREEGGTQLLH
jgi:hypothetical protein